MTVELLLRELRELGLTLAGEGGRLRVKGRQSQLTVAVQERLQECKGEVLAVLWRRDAMGRQMRQAGALPLLVARETEPAEGCCVSCGDPVPSESWGRCSLCAIAARLAIEDRLQPKRGPDGKDGTG